MFIAIPAGTPGPAPGSLPGFTRLPGFAVLHRAR